MPYFTSRQRFKMALGGFLLLIGFVVLIVTFLVVTKTVDVENVLQPDLLVNVMAVIGGIDILAGVLLLRLR
ncbi:hypothetical protein KAU85_03105 [Candidatus Bathyarchaeota archaeon]|nr:hypothetical protein [Candidatus Bathyarchaeota archaeon]MCK4482712.1 hypothetical protein [Candidatus Bathyarchaeota archaeon]